MRVLAIVLCLVPVLAHAAEPPGADGALDGLRQVPGFPRANQPVPDRRLVEPAPTWTNPPPIPPEVVRAMSQMLVEAQGREVQALMRAHAAEARPAPSCPPAAPQAPRQP